MTVNLETGREVKVTEVFKPSTLTNDGAQRFLSRLKGPTTPGLWGSEGCGDFKRADFFSRVYPDGHRAAPAATPFFGRDRFVLNWSVEGSYCHQGEFTAPYAKVRDLMKPEFAAMLPD